MAKRKDARIESMVTECPDGTLDFNCRLSGGSIALTSLALHTVRYIVVCAMKDPEKQQALISAFCELLHDPEKLREAQRDAEGGDNDDE